MESAKKAWNVTKKAWNVTKKAWNAGKMGSILGEYLLSHKHLPNSTRSSTNKCHRYWNPCICDSSSDDQHLKSWTPFSESCDNPKVGEFGITASIAQTGKTQWWNASDVKILLHQNILIVLNSFHNPLQNRSLSRFYPIRVSICTCPYCFVVKVINQSHRFRNLIT